ncbi:MAG: CBS domain-containing protein [Pseudomonadota bacterium]|nr:CBS domain-containing protein [Pseudomonadota bacterium]
MNVSSILKDKGSEVVSASPDATLFDIAKLLAEHGIGCVVVTDENGGIAGICSERDIVRTMAKRGPSAMEEPVLRSMTKKVVTCEVTDTVDRLMARMTAGRFRHLPVLVDDRLAGIVSIGDVVRMRIAEAEMEAAAMRDYIATG